MIGIAIIWFVDTNYTLKVVDAIGVVGLAVTDMTLSNVDAVAEKFIFTVKVGSHFK